MSFSGFIYDISLLGAIMITGAAIAVVAYNAFEIVYWKYVDWKLGKDDEGR